MPISKFYAHTRQLQMSKVIARLMAHILLSCGLHDAFCTRPTVSPRSPLNTTDLLLAMATEKQ